MLYRTDECVLRSNHQNSKKRITFHFWVCRLRVEIVVISLILCDLGDILALKDAGAQVLHLFLLDFLESFKRSPRKWYFFTWSFGRSTNSSVDTTDLTTQGRQNRQEGNPVASETLSGRNTRGTVLWNTTKSTWNIKKAGHSFVHLFQFQFNITVFDIASKYAQSA